MARTSRKKSIIDDIPKVKIYKTGIYARRSNENQSNETIESQIDEVKNYIRLHHNFKLVDVYADDGYSGTDFERPEFQRLMEDLRNGKIDCIVVKDLSRFAREYIKTGEYLNNIFPFLGVRFIAINDDYDNINVEPQEYFLASFKNIVHTHFAQETSRKVCQAKKTLQEQGKFIGSKPSYGYKRAEDDKHKLVINEVEAKIVCEIFNRVANGERILSICDDLNSHQTEYIWKPERIHSILKKEAYHTGLLAQRTSVKELYNNKDTRFTSKEEQLFIEVPVIVDTELWEKANWVLTNREYASNNDKPKNIYKNLIFCGVCKKKASVSFRKEYSYYRYRCSYCSSGIYASEKTLEQVVKNYIGLSDNEKLTEELLHQNVQAIFLFSKGKISFVDKVGDN